MPDDSAAPEPNPQPANPGPTPTGYQRTQGGSFKWVPPTPEMLGKLLPQYEIEALVGRGGMGAVYKGRQKALDRPVAIKILPPEVDAEDDSYTRRFKNEAKIMAKLDHPAIVPVFDFGEISSGHLAKQSSHLAPRDERAASAGEESVPGAGDARSAAHDALLAEREGYRTAPTMLYFVMGFVDGTDVH